MEVAARKTNLPQTRRVNVKAPGPLAPATTRDRGEGPCKIDIIITRRACVFELTTIKLPHDVRTYVVAVDMAEMSGEVGVVPEVGDLCLVVSDSGLSYPAVNANVVSG